MHQEAVAGLTGQIASAQDALTVVRAQLEEKQAVVISLQEQVSDAQERAAGLETNLGKLPLPASQSKKASLDCRYMASTVHMKPMMKVHCLATVATNTTHP